MRSERYRYRDLRVTRLQQQLLSQRDLVGFWRNRVGFDPVSRSALALWATPAELKRVIALDPDFWRPQMKPITRFTLRLLLPKVKVPPRELRELSSYWGSLGLRLKQSLRASLSREQRLAPGSAASDAKILEIGLALAKAHVDAVTDDAARKLGDIPGLLSLEQLAHYHHRTFDSFGLPKETYGGTPLPFVSDAVELYVGGDGYAHDADPHLTRRFSSPSTS